MAMSWKPTHGRPMSEEELKVPRNPGGKGWQAGARFQWVSHFGSKASNNKPKRERTKAKSAGLKRPAAIVRPTVTPGWARKYQ